MEIAKRLFKEWWLKNQCQGRNIAWELFKQQGKPIFGVDSSNVRAWIKEFKSNQVIVVPEITREALLKELGKGLITQDSNILDKIEDLKNNGYNIIQFE